ncbi:RDD family protein [Pedobacter sp. MC2016-14]|uniref:RDD family protein n=1 Tax=Pedobacter sp. MC2016-14 TaxID=2897327 RepID=UPI001E2AF41F|nr:RDD family protein [Pedobacter sp. MC2016-14]MCD0487022.1 RDD family protein [Pedobacter sp. MC2016-14]
METVTVNTSQHVAINYPVAGIGERLAASSIDLGIFWILYFLGVLIALSIGQKDETVIIVLVVIYASCFIFYSLLCEIFMNGQSVGKKILKIKVISLDGGQPGLGQFAIRWLFRILDVYTTGVIGITTIVMTDKKQRVGDIVAGTTLIKTVPQTKIEHIAFHTDENYIPVFSNPDVLNDQDISLVHEVLFTYYKTRNPDLIYVTAARVAELLSTELPEGMNELAFLQTVIKDYNYITSRA